MLFLALVAGALLFSPAAAQAAPFFFTTGAPDGRMAVASRPSNSGSGQIEIEAADDFVVTGTVRIGNASFTDLLPTGAPDRWLHCARKLSEEGWIEG